MSFAVSFSQLLLSLVFVVAAVAKLADRSGTRAAVEALGVPPRLSGSAAVVLPIAELAVAAALVPTATAGWGALAALALLGIFSLAIVRTLGTGATPDCNCFGGLTQTAVGRGTLIRNGFLAALAALVAVSAQSVSALSWITVPAAQDRVGIVLLIACVGGLGWFCWQLLQQNGRLLRRLDEEAVPSADFAALPPLEPGTAAPDFDGRDLHGGRISLDSLLAPGRPVALVFTSPGCGACAAALEIVSEAQRERTEEMTLAVISSGAIEAIEAKAAEFGLERVVPQADDSLFDAYRVHGVPGIVEIDPAGAVSKPVALGAEAIREVVLGSSPAPLHERVEVTVG